jgi:RimJ/RimL family protein N-acetyltransferase
MDRPRLSLPRETDRLVIRPPDPANAPAVQEAVEESFNDLHPWMPWANHLQTLDETSAYLRRAYTAFLSGEDFAVSVFLKETGQFVLGSGLHPRNWDVPRFEIGYWCRSSMQGNGFATETAAFLARTAFAEMGARKVEIRCDSRNRASRRVAELAGFHLEAELHCDDRANDGSLADTVVYAMLAGDLSPDA